MRQTLRPLVLVALGLTVAACGGDERSNRRPAGPAPQKTAQALRLELASPTLEAGGTYAVSARQVFSDGTEADVSGATTWVSTNPAVVTVQAGPDGATITATGEGTAQITAVFGDFVASATVTVLPAGEVLQAIVLAPAAISVRVGAQAAVVATGVYASGTQRDVSALVTWSSSDEAVATVVAGQVTGVAPGAFQISASLAGVSASAAGTVAPAATVNAVSVTGVNGPLAMGDTASSTAQASFSDGAIEDVTARASWSSSAPSVVSVNAGLLTAVGPGQATITATFEGASGTSAVTVSGGACAYPSGTYAIRQGAVLPSVGWTGAYDETGATRDFSTESFFCDAAFDAYSSLVVVVGAEWCPNCPDYKRRANDMQAQIEAAGGLLIYIEIEDRQGRPASHVVAQRAVNDVIGAGPGLRIGDNETQPTPMVFGAATNAVPTGYVIRKSDMTVIGDQGQSQYLLDFVALAHEAAGGTAPTNCGPSDEESFEPNNAVNQAGTLTPGQVVSGGICDANPDFYQVTHPGAWQLDLTFTHATGDLDVYVWDTMTNQPLQGADGSPVGGESSTDNESFTHSGPATVFVYGYNNATAPYQLRLTAN